MASLCTHTITIQASISQPGEDMGPREGGKRQSCSSVLLDHWMTSNGIQDRVGEAGKQGALH
jgi:hypothetical protein